MDRLLTVVMLLSAGIIVATMISLRRAHIRVEYSVSWLAAALTLFVLSRWESALEWMGAVLGISDPPAVLFSILIAILLAVLYRVSMIVSALKDNNIALAQKVAILEYQIYHLREGRETTAGR